MDKKALLDRAARSGGERVLLAHVLDRYERCRTRGTPTHTDFLSGAERAAAEELLRAAAIRSGYAFAGGYDGAERTMLCFLPDWQEEADAAEYMTALRVRWREGEALSHRDLLGSLMALGVVRGKIGDILPSPESADVLVSREIADYLSLEWKSAGRARLSACGIALSELTVPERRVREIRDTVATLRLDAVTACGFSMSRSKAAELIASGRVQKNHRDAPKGDAPVAQGDVISARGLGKFEVAEVGGLSKKGRTAILLRRYL